MSPGLFRSYSAFAPVSFASCAAAVGHMRLAGFTRLGRGVCHSLTAASVSVTPSLRLLPVLALTFPYPWLPLP